MRRDPQKPRREGMRKVTEREEEYSMEDKVAVKMPSPGLGVGQKEESRTQMRKSPSPGDLPAPGI